MKRSRRTTQPLRWQTQPLTEEEKSRADPWDEEVFALLQQARSNPLDVLETLVRLNERLKSDLSYQAHRRREGLYTSYDSSLVQWIEAIASAIVLLEKQATGK